MRQPGAVRPYVPAMVAPAGPAGYAPGTPSAGGYAAPGNVIPFRPRSSVLVKPVMTKDGSVVDPYAEFIAGQPDLAPDRGNAHLFEALVPDPSMVEGGAPQMAWQQGEAQAHEDPALDAYGPGGARASRSGPLRPNSGSPSEG